MSSDRRRYLRTKFDSRVTIEHPQHGIGTFHTGDVSDGGLFLENGPFELALGDTVTVQIQGVPGEAPLVKVTVVRRVPGGYGLQFAD